MSSLRKQRTSWTRPAQEQEYWLSYSDLLAGLLMIFVLMLFAALHHYGSLIDRAGDLASTRTRIIETLGSIAEETGVTVDPVTGAVRFPDGVLFAQNSAVLQPEGIEQLNQFADRYFSLILDDPSIRPDLRSLTIEGHTNADIGRMTEQEGYLYNLDLSQRRALAVMQHLIDAAPAHREQLKELVTASGRSFSQPICVRSGNVQAFPCPHGDEVDPERSRRIEILFRLNDEEALEQVRRLLLVR
jgi:chemotaxis protein MotB